MTVSAKCRYTSHLFIINLGMQGKARGDWEVQYKNVKKQYDDLLEKSQNDLIKIKIREKQLNDKIASFQQENQEMKELIEFLKQELRDKNRLFDSGSIIRQNQQLKTILSSKNETISSLTKQASQLNLKAVQAQQNKLKVEQELKGVRLKVKSLEGEMAQLHLKINNQLEDREYLVKSKNEAYQVIKGLEKSAKDFNQQLEKERKQLFKDFSSRDQEIKTLRQSLNSCEQNMMMWKQRQCPKCQQLVQQLELQKEMLRSVRMMLKVKEMELQKYQK